MNKDLQKLIDGLNVDLAHEYGSAIQYTYSAAVVSGLNRAALKDSFKDEINDEMGHALYLSDKISALGGTPTTEAAEVEQSTEVEDLLKAIKQAETDTIERYDTRRKQAEELGYLDLAFKLEDMIQDEAAHRDEIAKMLQ